MIEKEQSAITVHEVLGSQQLCKWDIIGVRIVDLGERYVLSSIILPLPRETAKDAIATIRRIAKAMSKAPEFKSLKAEYKNYELLAKKMWIKEIVEQWFLMHEAYTHTEQHIPELLNYDGDPLRFCTVEFSIKGARKEIIAKLDKMKDLEPELQGRKYTWLWLDNRERPNNRFGIGVDKEENKRCIDTHVQNPMDSSVHRLFATLQLTAEKLVIKVNSNPRAYITQDLIQEALGDLVGESTIKHEEEPEGERSHRPKKKAQQVWDSEAQDFYHQVLDKHYTEWMDTPLAALSNKTPRQTVKTKAGRLKVIEMIKEMEKNERRRGKLDGNPAPYSFDSVLKQLGIQEKELEA